MLHNKTFATAGRHESSLNVSHSCVKVPGVIVDLGIFAAAVMAVDHLVAPDAHEARVTPADIAASVLVELPRGRLDFVIDEGDGYAAVNEGVESEIRHYDLPLVRRTPRTLLPLRGQWQAVLE
jgi:hypothetical protein